EREIFREVAQDLFGRLRGAFEIFDLRERGGESGLAGAFAGVGGVEDLLLRVESRLEELLVRARVEPCVNRERGCEQRGAECGDFECSSCHGRSGEWLVASDW